MCSHIKGLFKNFETWTSRHIDCSQNVEAHNAAQDMIIEVFVLKACISMYLVKRGRLFVNRYDIRGCGKT